MIIMMHICSRLKTAMFIAEGWYGKRIRNRVTDKSLWDSAKIVGDDGYRHSAMDL